MLIFSGGKFSIIREEENMPRQVRKGHNLQNAKHPNIVKIKNQEQRNVFTLNEYWPRNTFRAHWPP